MEWAPNDKYAKFHAAPRLRVRVHIHVVGMILDGIFRAALHMRFKQVKVSNVLVWRRSGSPGWLPWLVLGLAGLAAGAYLMSEPGQVFRVSKMA